jgi:uroporphyrinogen-III synthase
MKLIITRPLDDAEPLAARLFAMGHDVVLLPLLGITPRSNVAVPKRNYQAITITSANAMRTTADLKDLYSTQMLTVGPQSRAAAELRGFRKVAAHGGDVDGLADHINSTLKPSDGPILYLSGSETSGDLEGRLRAEGFDIYRVITYDAVTQVEYAAPLVATADVQSADAVLLYSARSAKLWGELVAATQSATLAGRLMHFCLSANVAQQLDPKWPKKVAAEPNEPKLLALLAQPSKTE